ncbi:MAG: 3-dehydroquinate synthase [Akkermansiaceae bacterium]|jgi:3-dehydroquinate synthase|nr:3-dehydroquinate synthase [Luteolibacter sp.]
MDRHDFDIPITFKHRVIFTRDAFAADNSALANVLIEGGGRRVLVFIENTVAASWKNLPDHIQSYFEKLDFDFRGVKIFAGGEACKADENLVREVWREIDTSHIDRHSYVIAIGGGAFLDAVGYAVATAHRGLRLVRFPTTTLSQDDSGVGVKNAINAFGKKNWIGTFSVPFAVINDFKLLESQDPESSISGLIEAIKVALVKDGEFFQWIEANVTALSHLEREPFEECIKRSALLHARHIALGGDPFETGSSRPLDFGHWAAHKMEALTNYELSHAEAVAVGLALDTIYSQKIGFLSEENAERIINVLINLGLKTYHPALDWADAKGNRRVLAGLDEFREHLGGELTVLLLSDLGKGVDVHEFNTTILEQSIEQLREMWELAAH